MRINLISCPFSISKWKIYSPAAVKEFMAITPQSPAVSLSLAPVTLGASERERRLRSLPSANTDSGGKVTD